MVACDVSDAKSDDIEVSLSSLEIDGKKNNEKCDSGNEDISGTDDTKTENEESTDENSSFRGRPSSCVFVASLASTLSDDDLCVSVTENFKKYGELVRVKVLRDPANRPYAFVQYTNDKDAKKALKKAQGSMLNGRTLRCEQAKVNRTLYLKNENMISYVEVADLCERFGELEKIVPFRETNKYNKRYSYPMSTCKEWFVQFAYRDDAIRAYVNFGSESPFSVEWVQNIDAPSNFNLLLKLKKEKKKNNVINNNNININNSFMDTEQEKNTTNFEQTDEDAEISGSQSDSDYELENSDESESNNSWITIDKKSIFVGQLDHNTTKEKLNERFSIHGEIVDTNLIIKPTTVFAFIQYKSEESAAAALERENHAVFLNKTMHVQYKEIGGLHNRRNQFRRSDNMGSNSFNDGSNLKNYPVPQFNLAPPPINMYRRRPSMENDPMLSYLPPPPIPNMNDFDVNSFIPPYMFKNNYSYRRKSFPTNWSSMRNYSYKSESDTNQNNTMATDLTSETSNTLEQSRSNSTNNNLSSAGSSTNIKNGVTSNTNANNNTKNNNNSNNNNNSIGGVSNVASNNINSNNSNENHTSNSNGKKRFFKRNMNYNEPIKPFYYQQFYYQPMHYPVGPMGPTIPSQTSPGNHPYMMFLPVGPPPPSGSMMSPPLPLGQVNSNNQNSSKLSENPYAPSESESFVPENKQYNLDY